MEYALWSPRYRAIQAEFGYPFAQEEASARELLQLLPPEARERPLERAVSRLVGRDVWVVGLAPRAGAPPLWRHRDSRPPAAIIAADGAAERCLQAGIVPDLVVTDLDGPVPAEVAANSRGSLVVIHAHGDNTAALRRWVPQFPGEICGTWAGPPGSGLFNVGGFTDGDRAVFLAHHAGARRILLFGFDFDQVEEASPSEAAVKRRKLRWASRLIGELAHDGPVPILVAHPDGSESPYSEAGGEPATQ